MRTHDMYSCVLCWQNRRGRTNYRGHWGYHRPRAHYVTPPWEIAKMKRPQKDEGGANQALRLGEISSLFPRLTEQLVDATWEDGSPRELSTLLFFADLGRWKCCLNDRALSRVAFVSGRDPEEVLTRLEQGLQEETLDWRPVAKRVRTPGQK